jgi:hypothetical protein
MKLLAQSSHNFTEQYTFERKNGENFRQFSAFYEPKMGIWLLTKDDTFNGDSKDINQWVLKPNGEIILLGEDEFGKVIKLTYTNYGLKTMTQSFKYKPTGKPKVYGKNKYGWSTFTGYTYTIPAGRMQAKATLSKGKVNFSPLYAFNSSLDVENHLPGFSKVNYTEIIPKNYLILEDEEVKLISVSPTEYYLEIPK